MKKSNSIFFVMLLAVALMSSCGERGVENLASSQVWNTLEGSWLEIGATKSYDEAQTFLTRKNVLVDSLRALCFADPNNTIRRTLTFIKSDTTKYCISHIFWNIRRVPDLQNTPLYECTISDKVENGWILEMNYKMAGRVYNDTIKYITDEAFIVREKMGKMYRSYVKIENLLEYAEKLHQEVETVVAKNWIVRRKTVVKGDSREEVVFDPQYALVLVRRMFYGEPFMGYTIYTNECEVHIGRYAAEHGLDMSNLFDKIFLSFGYYDFWSRQLYVSVCSMIDWERSEYFNPDPVLSLEDRTDTTMTAVWKRQTADGVEQVSYYLEAL